MSTWESLTPTQQANLLDLYPELAPDLTPQATTLPPFRDWALECLPHYFTHNPSPFHDWLTGELDGLQRRRGQRRNILAPRGAAKSTWSTVAYPLYCALHGLEPYTVLTSDTGGQASKFLEAIRSELVSNEELRRRYPRLAREGPTWRQDRIQLTNGCMIEALGTGTKLRGRRHRQHRPTLILVDDPQNTNHIISALQRDRSWEWLTKDVANAGGPTTNILVLGTALHRDCIVCRLQRTPGWQSRLWRAVISWPERMDLWAAWEDQLMDHDNDAREEEARAYYEAHRFEMDHGAKVLWPDREPLYDLMLLRASAGRNAFECERQNNPVNPETCEFPEEYFTRPGFRFDRWPADLNTYALRVMALDPSKGKDARKGDYSAIAYVGVQRSGVCDADADLQRRPTSRIVEDTVQGVIRFRPHSLVVEANQFQELLAGELQREATRHGITLPLYLQTNVVSKLTRIRRVEPWLSQRKLRVRHGSAGGELLLSQLRDFPNGDHDDGPDALDMAIQRAQDMLLGRAA